MDARADSLALWHGSDLHPASDRLAALAGGCLCLEMRGVAASYGSSQILHHVDLFLRKGQSLCLVGPNGAGKSTVLNAIFGFAEIRSGTVRVAGKEVSGLPAHARLRDARIGYVLQEGAVFTDLTVQQNLALGAYRMSNRREAKRALERAFDRYPSLAARRRLPARVLSGGERRLLDVARALMMDPQLLLLDEPSIGLDPRSVEALFGALRALQVREGKSILIVEQNVRDGLAFADVGYLLVAGRVVAAGTGSELLQERRLGELFLGE